MRLLKMLFRAVRTDHRLADLAREVAVRCHGTVWSQVQNRAVAMRLSEARGYVRARAVGIISSEVDQMLRREAAVDLEMRDRLVEDGLRRVVTLVMRDLLHTPPRYQLLRRVA